MRSKLQEEHQVAKQRGDIPKLLAIEQALAKKINRSNPARLLTSLDQIYRQCGKWKPTEQRSLTDRADEAGQVLTDVGLLGQHWRQLLVSYGAMNLPNNPIYRA